MKPRLLAAAACVVAAACGTASSTPTPSDWSRHELPAEGPRVEVIAAGGDSYVGIGGGAQDGPGSGIWTSPDAVAWTPAEPARVDGVLVDIVAGGPGFVAISGDPAGAWTSTDGDRWEQAPDHPDFGGATMSAVAAASGRLVAVGVQHMPQQAAFWTSEDGVAWRRVTVPDPGDWARDVLAGGPGFVAVGTAPAASPGAKGAVWISADGVAWERVADDGTFDGAQLAAIAADGGRLVAVGFRFAEGTGLLEPMAWTSADGRTWTPAEVNDESAGSGGSDGSPQAFEGATMGALARTSSGWIAAGTALDMRSDGAAQDLAIWTSADGSSWQRQAHDPAFEMTISTSFAFSVRSVTVASGRTIVTGITADGLATTWISPAQPGGTVPSPRPSPPPTEAPPPNDATPAPDLPTGSG